MINQFIKWFQDLGGHVPDNFEAVNTRYVYDPVPVSSFKDRAEEIKKKYNHKFKPKWDHTKPNFIGNYPDVSKLNFERKNGR